VADLSNLNSITDTNKKEFLYSFVVPQGLLRLSQLLKVTDKNHMPVLGSQLDSCTDNGKLSIPDNYRTGHIDADFLLFVGSVKSSESYLAYAAYCVLGRIKLF
jgi:hypothetical protein